jgi:carboxymethylenebutenolidase
MPHEQPHGFLAVPTTGKGPGLLVLHAWWGLNETMKALCKRLAAEGFVTFAPDLYRGKIAATIEDAKILSRGLNDTQAKSDIADAVSFLSERTDLTGPGLGVIGFSLGVYFALGLSTEDPDRVRAVVVFYGTGPGDFNRSKAAYLGHFGETDEYEPAAEVKSLEDALRTAGRPVTFHTYAGTGHWFFEPDRSDAYNEGAARLAWERTVAFLRKELPVSARNAVRERS